jgi:hypothetical protein
MNPADISAEKRRAVKRPVVCFDLEGSSLAVTIENSFRVPSVNLNRCIAVLAEALSRSAMDNEQRHGLALASREHVREHLRWSRDGVVTGDLYSMVL